MTEMNGHEFAVEVRRVKPQAVSQSPLNGRPLESVDELMEEGNASRQVSYWVPKTPGNVTGRRSAPVRCWKTTYRTSIWTKSDESGRARIVPPESGS